MSQRWVALLGRRDVPTDAVEDYCRYLSGGLEDFGIHLELKRIDWEQHGWRDALRKLEGLARQEKNISFLVQYTALAWSRRGFSWRVLSILRVLKKHGARCGVVFHDLEPYFGSRLIDRLRRRVQLSTMRSAMRLADLSVVTVPPGKIPWVAGSPRKPLFIPIGANLPAPETAWAQRESRAPSVPTFGVFSLSGGQVGAQEARLISQAALHVTQHIGPLRIVVIGRSSDLAESALRKILKAERVELVVHGILPAEQVVSELAACDAMLFVRGPLSSRRGSAIAGIACGLPVIAREGWETAEPITQAGVVLLPPNASSEFGPALLGVLVDKALRESLAERSRRAQTEHFSWRSIAAKFATAFREGSTPS